MSSPAKILSFVPLSLLLFSCAAAASSSSVADPPTVYEALEEYDFPRGLLPMGVKGYTLNKDTGEFEVNIGETCTFTIEGYDLKYKSTISGVISRDKLTQLKGVSVKVLLFWVNIVEVTRYGDELDFSVGILSAGFEIEGFEESPQCGCGFDCNNMEVTDEIQKKNMMMNLTEILISSW